MSTPYDGKIGLWHESSSQVGQTTISALGLFVSQTLHAADAVYVKTAHGGQWMSTRDSRPGMRIGGPTDITNWVNTLNTFNLETHAWVTVVGTSINAEIQRMVDSAKVTGIKSLIVHVDPASGVWQGTRTSVLQIMSNVRQQLGNAFHIGLAVDSRRRWYDATLPDAWRPYVNSLHPTCYWDVYQRDPDDVITEAYVTWGAYGLPIYPVLQAFDTVAADVREAQDNARGVRGALGISYYRLGTISPLVYSTINEERVLEEAGPDEMIRTYSWTKIIDPDERAFQHGTHTGQSVDQVFSVDEDVRGRIYKYKSTRADADTVFAQWVPRLPEQGTYEISIYVPDDHASTREAVYHIHGIVGAGTELLVRFNQSRYRNQWVPLVVYDFQPGINGGRVNLTDLTGEPDKEIAFSAIRWRRVISQRREEVEQKGNGFDSPVGTSEQRTGDQIFPTGFREPLGFAVFYTAVGPSYHTGIDISYPADARAPVYAAADGVVTNSSVLQGSWGYVIVIRHDPLPDGRVIYTRYAHVEQNRVVEGQQVARGDQIANIGNAFGRFKYHLHYDISISDILERNPAHWPGRDYNNLIKHYVDPKEFTKANRPKRT